MVTILVRMRNIEQGWRIDLDKFLDWAEISDWSYSYFGYATYKGIVQGYLAISAGNAYQHDYYCIKPKKYVTRAEFAKLYVMFEISHPRFEAAHAHPYLQEIYLEENTKSN